MTQTVDVSGLPESVVHDIEKLVQTLRQNVVVPNEAAKTADKLSREEWLKRWNEWTASRISTNPNFDDSRESIYECAQSAPGRVIETENGEAHCNTRLDADVEKSKPNDWIVRFDSWIAKQKPSGIVVDDSRESIYDRACE